MNKDFTFLCDPTDGSVLISKNGRMHSKSNNSYLIIKGIPRFVDEENYSKDFGS